jgi:hypothetical protein
VTLHRYTVVASKGGASASHNVDTHSRALDAEFSNRLWDAFNVNAPEQIDALEVQSVTYVGTVPDTVPPPSALILLGLRQISLAFIE